MRVNNIYFKIKVGLIVLLLVYLFLTLGGGTKDVPLDTITDALSGEEGVSALVLQPQRRFQSTFQADGDYEAAYYTAESLMDVTELLVVKAGEDGDLDTLQAAVESHVADRLDTFRNYGTNQAELLEDAIVLQKGDYLFLAISEHAVDWEDCFLSAVK